MKVFLLAPYPVNLSNIATTQYPPLGLLYIGGAVKDAVESLQILDANYLCLSVEQTMERIRSYHPDILGISINVVTAHTARIIAQKARELHPNIKLIAGGPHPTIFPKEWLDFFDIVMVGEGERPFQIIIDLLKKAKPIPGNIPGICIPGGEIIKSRNHDVDSLPYPAYDYLVPSLQSYSKKARTVKANMAPILTSRGCPYGCVFCDKSVHGQNFRPRSAESVIAEVKWLHDTYGVRQLDILDDNFTFDMERAEKILDGIMQIDQFAINCQNGIRADRITENLVQKMKKAGVFRVGIGIESGKRDTLVKLKKSLNLDDVLKAIKIFRKANITVQGYFIVGFPYETEKDIVDTLRFAKKANPHFANFSNFFPIVGTPIYNELYEKGDLVNDSGEVEEGFFRLNSHIKNTCISEYRMKKLYSWCWRSFYFRPAKIFDILVHIHSFKELQWVSRIGFSILRSRILKSS